MNSEVNQEITDTILFEGIMPVWLLTTLCVVVLAVICGLFWRERRSATRPVFVPLLFAFRCLAVAGVWLALANPTAVRKTRQTKPKHSAVYLDTSASMNIQDAARNRGNAARWSSVIGGAATESRPLDQAVALLGAARVQIAMAATATDAALTDAMLSKAESACREANDHLQASRRFPGVNTRLDPLLSQFSSEVITPLERLRQMVDPSRESRESVRAPMVALARKLGEMRGLVQSLADELPSAEEAPSTQAAMSRMAYAQHWLAESESDWLKALSKSTTLDRNQFDQSTSPVQGNWKTLQAADPNDTSATTDLQNVLNELGRRASDDRLDFAVLATDGVHNAASQPLRIPESLSSTPILVIPFGDYEIRRDIDLHGVDAPKSILVRDQLTVSARISASLCEGDSTVVELLNGDQVLDSTELRFEEPRVDRVVELHWRPGAPQTRELIVRVRPLAREASLGNNERTLKVSVVEDHFEILVADAYPRWETRYLFSLFRRETQSKATTLLFNPVHAYPGGNPPPQPALPFGIDAWQQFQVVILGDLNPKQMTPEHQKTVKRYVENGGRLVVIAGAESMPNAFAAGPFADLLPVERQEFTPPAEGFTVRLTREGLVSDVLRISGTESLNDSALWETIYNALPIYDVSAWSKPKPSARVLIEAVPRLNPTGPGRVYLATQTYGRGSVTFFSSPSSYSLRWRSGDRYHYRFWGQLVRALVAQEFGSGSSLLRMTTDQSVYQPETPVRVKLRAQAANGAPLKKLEGEIVARQLDQTVARTAIQPSSDVAGEYEATFERLPSGVIKLGPEGPGIANLLGSTKSDSPLAIITIERRSTIAEMLPQTQPPPFFAMINSLPTAMVVAPGAVPAVLSHFDLAPTVTESTLRRPLWNEWWLLDLIVGCLALEWIGRKIAGLI
jgi:hypothetical protein